MMNLDCHTLPTLKTLGQELANCDLWATSGPLLGFLKLSSAGTATLIQTHSYDFMLQHQS